MRLIYVVICKLKDYLKDIIARFVLEPVRHGRLRIGALRQTVV